MQINPLTLATASAALRRLARREDVKAAVLATPALYHVLKAAALRYVAGETQPEALTIARDVARRGHRATIDFMGEDTRDATVARAATDEFLALIEALGPVAGDALGGALSVSLDLSHIGLAVGSATEGEALAQSHLLELAAAAAARGREVIISMEDSARTDAILCTHAAVSERYPRVGITVQATLHRTPGDLARLLAQSTARGAGGRIRLVKGAYLESPARALPRGPELDARYAALGRQLIDAAASGQPVSLATHDASLVADLTRHAAALGGTAACGPGTLQFEMLYGVCTDRLEAIRAEGYATQQYLVYGTEWYLYLCHRLAEYPVSLLDALTDVVRALPALPGEPAIDPPTMVGSSARSGRR